MAKNIAFLSLLALSNALVVKQDNFTNSSSVTSSSSSQSVTFPPFTLSNSSTSAFSRSSSRISGPLSSFSGTAPITKSSANTRAASSSSNSTTSVSRTSSASQTGPSNSGNSKSSKSFKLTGTTSTLSSTVTGSSKVSSTGKASSSSSLTWSSNSTTTALSSSGKVPSASSASIPGSGVLPFSTTSSRSSSDSSGSPTSTAPFTFSNTWSDEESTLSPASFTWFNVPTTTIPDAAETSEAVFLGGLFFALQSNRKWLTDDKLRSQYLDDVKKSKDETLALLDDLDVKPPDIPDCKNTKRKRSGPALSERQLRALLNDRSIISSIGNAISGAVDDVAKLLTCASDVVNNLVDSVNAKVPDLTEIENLTDTLAEIGKDLQEEEKNEPSSTKGSSARTSTTSSSSSSCSGSTAFPVCTQTISLSTSFLSGGTSSSTVATITQTSCSTSTVSGCSATGKTATTTVSGSTSSIPPGKTAVPYFLADESDADATSMALKIEAFQTILACMPSKFTLPIPTAGCKLASGSNGTTSASGSSVVSSTGSNTSTRSAVSGSSTGPSTVSSTGSKLSTSTRSSVSGSQNPPYLQPGHLQQVRHSQEVQLQHRLHLFIARTPAWKTEMDYEAQETPVRKASASQAAPQHLLPKVQHPQSV
ncbi:hypothetical protein LCER1_G001653 [Lachnellula cervina]|uniref:Uncharacterized protein n=1 Tax=Lachnellula cervina TaxID=1316786 RepID=A0A7D8YYA6_9HELO|nr:hypothetical protein LCER1_G001653 [Lachnellula cervina]